MNGPTVRLMGNVTRDVELQYGKTDGTPFVVMNVAVNQRRRDQEDITTYFRVTVWRHTAQYAARSVMRGTGIYAEGTLSARPYTRNDGSPDLALEVSANDFEIITRGAPAAAHWAEHRPNADRPAGTDTPQAPAAATVTASTPASAQEAPSPNTEPPPVDIDPPEEPEYYADFADEEA